MKDRGILWNKERWFSFCSRHKTHDKDCEICNTGSWVNVWYHNISSALYWVSPRLWVWWANK